jgi:hypothetical protein
MVFLKQLFFKYKFCLLDKFRNSIWCISFHLLALRLQKYLHYNPSGIFAHIPRIKVPPIK